MNKYELALVLRPDLDEEAKAAELQKVQDLIVRFEGTVDKVDDWGKKRLAYPIRKLNEGFYYFIDFSAAGTTPAEIESRVRIMEGVLRYLIVRKEG